jgi:hypothetical protein
VEGGEMDWRKSKAHLLLLSKFIHANSFEDFARHDYWKNMWNNVLGEPLTKAIKRFEDEKMLITADLNDLLLYKYRVNELKDMLKQQGLPISGSKDELVQRLVQADPNGMRKAVAELKLLKCDERGREIAEQYLVNEKEKRAKVEFQVMEYLTKRKFREASLTVAAYEAEQVFPRGMGVNWKHYDPNHDIEMLNTIFGSKPRSVAQLGDEKLEALRIGAAMMALWGTNTVKEWLPTDFETGLPFGSDAAARNVLSYARNRAILLGLKKESVVKGVKVLSARDNRTCQKCASLDGKVFTVDEALEKMLLPDWCNSEEGYCRCVYQYETR